MSAAHLTPSGFAALAARNEAETEARGRCAMLSDVQRTALILLAKGLNREEVAQHMGRSVSNVDFQTQAATNVLGVATRIEAAVMLTRAGLV